MKNHRQTMKVYLPIILFGLLAVCSALAKEPVYNGKPLSEYLLIMHGGQFLPYRPAEAPSPVEAIRHMGTNAIPTLIDILGVTDQNKQWVLRKLKCREARRCFSYTSLDDFSSMAVEGFGILGSNAVSAIPQINKLFRDVETCSAAAQALAAIGPQGVAALTNGLASTNMTIRGVTLWVIGEKAGMDSNTVMRIMLNSLKENPSDREIAARYLARKDPALAIPALMPLLDVDNYNIVGNAAHALSSYGAAAKVAIPKLLMLYTNAVVQRDNTQISTVELMWALKAIDLEAAEQAEAFSVSMGSMGASHGYTTNRLPNGKILIAGGSFQTTTPTKIDHVFSDAKLFDLATKKWEKTGSMNVAREFHTATLLSNGKVLVAGGSDLVAGRVHYLTSAELYDSMTGQWTVTGSMNNPHPSERAALQPNGKVLVYEGGADGYPILGHELYDPATGTWMVVPKDQERNPAWRASTDQH